MAEDPTLTSSRGRAYDRIVSNAVELDDTMAAEGDPTPRVPDGTDDPRRLGVATQERVRMAVHARVFGAPQDPVRIGRYTVLKRIGQGGMGVVYAAYDTELDRKVALKLLHFDGGESGAHGHGERLTREAKALAKLSHPSIVAVHEVGVHDGNVFVAMEFVEGETLREHVGRRTLPWREIVALYVQAGRGLAAAHAAGLVHRDFKPDNALVGTTDERVRVLDFGLARDLGDRDAAPSLAADAAIDRAVALTQTGTLLGTPAYMAPEQYVGAGVDAHADQFAFCVSLWEALYRQRPFDDTTVASVAAAILSGRRRPPPADSGVPTALHRVLERGLELRALDRYSSMGELVDILESIGGAARRGRIVLSVVAVLLAIVIGGAVWIGREREHSSRADQLADEAAVEHARAEQALQELGDRERAVLLAEAKLLLERDPTTAIAKLAQLDAGAPQWGTVARVLAADARDRGVARRVRRLPPDREARRWWRSGAPWIVSGSVTRDDEALLDLEHGTVIALPSTRELVLAGGGVLTATKRGLWWTPPGAPDARVLDETQFYSDFTTQLRASGNGRFVALVGEQGEGALVRVHDLETGTIRTEHFESGTEIAGISDDGRRMVVYAEGRLFVHGGPRELELVRDTALSSLDVAVDFGTLAWGMREPGGRDVLVIVRTDGRELHRIAADGLARDDVDYDPRGARLALRRRGGGVGIIALADGHEQRLTTAGEVERARWSSDGTYLLLGDDRHVVYVWRPSDGGLRTIQSGVEIVDLELDAEHDRLRVLGREEEREYDGVIPAPRHAIEDKAVSVAVDGGLRTMVVAHERTLTIRRDELPLRKLEPSDSVGALAVSPDGERFATAGGVRVSLWTRDGELVAEAKDPDAPMRLHFDPSGERLAWIGHSGTVVVWWPLVEDHPRMYEPSRLGVHALAFMPGSDRIGVVGWDHLGPLFYLLDPTRGVVGVIPVEVPDDIRPRAIALSRRDQLAFAASGDGVFIVAAKGGRPRRLGGRDVADAQLFFSPDGRQLAAVGGRSGATVWDVDSGASYEPTLAGVQPHDGAGTIGADGAFALVADGLVTQTVLGLGGGADDVRAWVAAATDLHVDRAPLALTVD